MASRLTGWCTKAALLVSTLSPWAILSTPAEAQAPAPNAAAISGQISAPLGSLAVSAQVRICPITASQSPCTPVAQLYTNSALTVAQPNPVATDQYGNFKVFVAAGLYLIQVQVAPAGPLYTYYYSAGSSSAGGGSAAPPYSVQFASQTAGQFSSDPTIFINPTQHIFEAPEVYVPGTGSGVVELGGQTSGNFVTQTVSDSTAAWTFTWPTAAAGSGTNCITGTGTPVTTAQWQPCVLSGAFLPLTGGTLTGSLTGTSATFQTTNTVANAAQNPTSGDIGAKVNAALATCGSQCTVYIPAGSYTFSTQIQLPLNNFSTFALQLDPGATLFYTGTSDAIKFPVQSGGPTEGNCRISGGQLFGNASATSGIHVLPTNTCNISDMLVAGFTGGIGVWIEGANAVNVTSNLISNNQTGVLLSPTYCSGSTCGTGVSGSAFTPNAVHLTLNTIVENSQWGVASTDPVTHLLSGALNVVIANNDLENNGTAGTSFGAVTVGRSHGLVVENNYFEGSPRQIVLGIPAGADGTTRFFASQGPVIRDNFFTLLILVPGGPPGTYEIELLDTQDAVIEGNAVNAVSENSNSCFINTLVNNGSNIGELGTYLGKNHFETDPNSPGTGNYTCVGGAASALVGAGSFPIVNSNYQLYLAYLNWPANATLTTETVAIQGLTATGTCIMYPISANARTSFAAQTAYIASVGANSIVINHPAAASQDFNLYCTKVTN